MPLYFFSITRDGKPSPIRDGLELADDKAAWEEATTTCGEVLRDLDGSLKPGDGWNMQVSNHQGKTVYVLTFDSKAL
jgi:hypothetical protein